MPTNRGISGWGRDGTATGLSRGLRAFALAVALAGCADDPYVPPADGTGKPAAAPAPAATTGTHRVAGRIMRGGAPVVGAQVSIDGVLNWTVESDASGQFAIADVTTGTHSLKVAQNNWQASASTSTAGRG